MAKVAVKVAINIQQPHEAPETAEALAWFEQAYAEAVRSALLKRERGVKVQVSKEWVCEE